MKGWYKNEKKILALILVALMTVSMFAACGAKPKPPPPLLPMLPHLAPAAEEEAPAASSETDASGASYTIGICNYVDDASLNQIVENIQSQLADIGAEKGVTFHVEYDNCNADSNLMSQIISNFQADNSDLLVAVATPVAMAMQAATEESGTPVVFAAVSDPVSVGLVDSLEAPGSNLTGTSDYLDTAAVMNLMFVQNPDLQKVGLLYDLGQDSAASAIESAKAYLEDKGVEVIERTGTSVDEIALAAQALVSDGVEAVFTPTDNTVMKSELTIYETFAEAGIPHYTGADSLRPERRVPRLRRGLRKPRRGDRKHDCLHPARRRRPAATAVKTFDNGTATINTEICEQLGIDFDELSEKFAPYCTKVQSIVTAESFDDVQ